MVVGVALFMLILATFRGEDEPNEFVLGAIIILFFGGILTGLISGIYALIQMLIIPPQNAYSKLKARIGTIISGLIALFLLINIRLYEHKVF